MRGRRLRTSITFVSGASHLAGEVVLIRPGYSFEIGRRLKGTCTRYLRETEQKETQEGEGNPC